MSEKNPLSKFNLNARGYLISDQPWIPSERFIFSGYTGQYSGRDKTSCSFVVFVLGFVYYYVLCFVFYSLICLSLMEAHQSSEFSDSWDCCVSPWGIIKVILRLLIGEPMASGLNWMFWRIERSTTFVNSLQRSC